MIAMQGRIEDIARESFHELMYATGLRLEDDRDQGTEVLLTNKASDKGRDEGYRDYEDKVRIGVRERSEWYVQGTFSDVPI
jgi:hypothetical protein